MGRANLNQDLNSQPSDYKSFALPPSQLAGLVVSLGQANDTEKCNHCGGPKGLVFSFQTSTWSIYVCMRHSIWHAGCYVNQRALSLQGAFISLRENLKSNPS